MTTSKDGVPLQLYDNTNQKSHHGIQSLFDGIFRALPVAGRPYRGYDIEFIPVFPLSSYNRIIVHNVLYP